MRRQESADLASDLKANTEIELCHSPGVKFSAEAQSVPHYIITTLAEFLQYCRGPFNEFDFMEAAHRLKSAAEPNDPVRSELFHMGRFNRLLQELQEYVERNIPKT